MLDERVDIKENSIVNLDKELLAILLIDRTTNKNIIWATDNYAANGKGYRIKDYITIEKITGYNGNVIRPRIKKNKKEQEYRTKEKAEVFTPSWICNAQNNLIDDNRLYKECFNKNDDNKKTWKTKSSKIKFSKNFTWEMYVKSNVLEITCGEAPYLVSRYDTVTGNIIETKDRIGLLDRKIRVINENIDKKDDKMWIKWVLEAYMHVYAYEWQGDSLLIARENLLYTFKDYYIERFKKEPSKDILKKIAEIISWNIWQMDGLKCVVPLSCKKEEKKDDSNIVEYINKLNGIKEEKKKKYVDCEGCKNNLISKHNGKKCIIRDWDADEIIEFVSMVNK